MNKGVIRIESMPRPDIYEANKTISPLSIFYMVVLTRYMTSTDLRIDPSRIVINREDGKELYQLIHDYIRANLPNVKPAESTEQTWKQLGPKTSKTVPRGQVYLLPGYVSLK